LIGAVGVVLFDVGASFLSLGLGFNYSWAAIGSWLLYMGVGFAVARAEPPGSSLRAGAVMGLVDATFGWAASWVIGTGQVPGASLGTIVVVVVMVTFIGAVLGGVGGLVARWGRPRERGAV
jgi:hypothetical protein